METTYTLWTLHTRILILLLTLASLSTRAQKVNEVLDVGPDEIIQGRAKFLLKFNGKVLEYDFWDDEKTRFRPLKDSVLILSKQGSVSVYIRPLNPLNYSIESTLQFTPSAINEEAGNALELIGKSLTNLVTQQKSDKQKAEGEVAIARKVAEAKRKKGDPPVNIPEPPPCPDFVQMVDLVKKIEALLKKDQKGKVKEIFTQLKSMSFDREEQTKQQLDEITPKLEPLATDLGDINAHIKDLETLIAQYDCPLPHPPPYIVQSVFNYQLGLIKTALNEQTKRYNNLKKSLDLVRDAYTNASASDEGLKWMVAFKVTEESNDVEVKKKTVSNFLVRINDDGYTISESGEIVTAEKKLKTKALVRLLKFQRFLPEVIPGTAYSFLKFPKFGVTTDANGKQVVSEAGEENFKRINFSAMVNFNYFIPQSAVHPFVQIGIGTNTDYPSFFTGGGFRFDVGGSTVKALSISGGMASTWIKKLKTLKLGDFVKGAADVEKDITHEFKWPPKAYIAIQLKF